ncbi:MAG TPA: GNAT family N-acetyltransferase, partial [Arenibaculum sp.]|nr:GNAT family N-acetyltransferase [Arenibaculum sp.]
WLDLAAEPDALRRALMQKWRNALNQAERHGLDLDIDTEGHLLDWLVDPYLRDKAERGYAGPSPALLRAFYDVADDACRPVILRARAGSRPVAGILLVRHARAATYQVGWTSAEGRALRAHHFLLWNAALWLRRAGTGWLDLGGVNNRDAAGIARVKAGMGGRPLDLVGGYV